MSHTAGTVELGALAKRCEEAVGPDTELDLAIWLTCVPGSTSRKSIVKSSKGLWPDYEINETRDKTHKLVSVPPYTASIEAAMTLALPDRLFTLWQASDLRWYAKTDCDIKQARASTPALATSALWLRALAEPTTMRDLALLPDDFSFDDDAALTRASKSGSAGE